MKNQSVKQKQNMKGYQQQLVDSIRALAQTQGLNTVFTNFLEVTAMCLSAETDPTNRSERETRYEEIMAGMDVASGDVYAKMLIQLYLAVRESIEEPRDVLGAVYHELNLNNEWNGQYFTPDDVCRMMGMIVGVPNAEEGPVNRPIAVNGPCCGSGAMILGYVYAMQKQKAECRDRVLFIAQDIDIRCVWMTYIQLTLYQIPAVVIHGNTLTMEEWSRWYTPYVTYVPSTGCVDMPTTVRAEKAVV